MTTLPKNVGLQQIATAHPKVSTGVPSRDDASVAIPCLTYEDNQGAMTQHEANSACYNYCRGSASDPETCAAMWVYYSDVATDGKPKHSYKCCPKSAFSGAFDLVPGNGEFVVVSQVRFKCAHGSKK